MPLPMVSDRAMCELLRRGRVRVCDLPLTRSTVGSVDLSLIGTCKIGIDVIS